MATVWLDPHWRRMEELFSTADLEALHADHTVLWGQNTPASQAAYAAALPEMQVLIAAEPKVDSATLGAAPNLTTIIEVSGAFPPTINYEACFERGIEVLSCAPGFRCSVAEMALAMLLASGRGLVEEHERFRRGEERWLADNPAECFSLYGATIGFVGYGAIARETARLMAPFSPRIIAYDPYLPHALAQNEDVELLPLDDVLQRAQAVIITASPSTENAHMIGARELALMQDGAHLLVISRAHLVDFVALSHEAKSGRLRIVTDVFPEEPVAPADPIRHWPNSIFSPHRAAAVPGGRQLIGAMILHDLAAIARGEPIRNLTQATPQNTALYAGVGDAKAVEALAEQAR